MNLKTKTIIFSIFFVFGFFLAGNVLAFYNAEFWGQPFDDVIEIRKIAYDEEGKFFLEIRLKDTTSFNQILLPNNPSDVLYHYGVGGTIFISTENNSDIKFGSSMNETVIPWICQTTTGTFYGKTVWVIGTEPVKCFPTVVYIPIRSNQYVQHYIYNASGITKADIDNYMGNDFLETSFLIPSSPPPLYTRPYHYFNFLISRDLSEISKLEQFSLLAEETTYFPFIAPPEAVNGVCGTGNGQNLTTTPPEGTEACLAGTIAGFSLGYNEMGELRYSWVCEGSNGGSSVDCSSAEVVNAINGVCGTANEQTLSISPTENEMCETGNSLNSLSQTMFGWTWFCYGFNGGSSSFCSAIYNQIGIPPELPPTTEIPTPTDCDNYSGIEKILCNLGNMIQGIFLPSVDKLSELQTKINKIGNVFPFNYLRAIGSVFSNSTYSITSGGLTMTIMNNTRTLNAGFYNLPIVDKIKQFSTILIYLVFSFWAINYIKDFFR